MPREYHGGRQAIEERAVRLKTANSIIADGKKRNLPEHDIILNISGSLGVSWRKALEYFNVLEKRKS